ALAGCNAEKSQPSDQGAASADPLEGARSALEDREWTDAIQLAELVLESDPENQGARDIVLNAEKERDNLSRYNQARALFEAEQYDKAYVKLSNIPADSVYAVRANNMSLRIRQAVVLPEIIRRPGDATMRRVLIGAFSRGSTDDEVKLAHELCEEHAGECQMKWFTRESPRRWVTLGSYYIDQYEVSVAQYSACVEGGECNPIDW